jgi:hypothetical protein
VEPFSVDVDMNYAPPTARELDECCLRALVAPDPTCNGQLLVRLYGERADLIRWLDDYYGDDDGVYKLLIRPTSEPQLNIYRVLKH